MVNVGLGSLRQVSVRSFHPRPMSAAQIDVANTETTTPRMVFAGPNMH